MSEAVFVGTYTWDASVDKIGVLLTRVANVVVLVDEQFKLRVAPDLQSFVQAQPEFIPGGYTYAKYMPGALTQIGSIPVVSKAGDQVHVYIDPTLVPGSYQFQFRGIICTGTLSIP